MTYPNHNYGYPQGHPGQSPVEYPNPIQQYSAPPVQPQPQYGAPAPAMPTFVDPTAGGGSSGLKMRDLVGRFCAVTVTKFDPTATFQNKANPTVTLTVVVFDGPTPLLFGDDRLKQIPHQWAIDQLPYEATGVLSSHVNTVTACSPHVGTGAVLLGTFEYGITANAGNSKPINFVAVDASDPRRQMAAQWFGAKIAGQVVNPTPRPLTPEAAATLNPQAAPAGAVPMSYPAQYGAPAPAQPVPQVSYSQPVPASTPAIQPAGAVLQQQHNAAAVASGQGLPVPTGWDAGVWASLNPQQQAQIAAQINGGGPGM